MEIDVLWALNIEHVAMSPRLLVAYRDRKGKKEILPENLEKEAASWACCRLLTSRTIR